MTRPTLHTLLILNNLLELAADQITALASATEEENTPGRRGAKPSDSIEQEAKAPVKWFKNGFNVNTIAKITSGPDEVWAEPSPPSSNKLSV